MTKTSILVAAAVIVAATGTQASAHSTRKIDRALDTQEHRIEQGRKSGQITWREGRKLRSEQRQIAALREAYLLDGKLTAREYKELRGRQEAASWSIVNEKHDGWRRWRILPRVGR